MLLDGFIFDCFEEWYVLPVGSSKCCVSCCGLLRWQRTSTDGWRRLVLRLEEFGPTGACGWERDTHTRRTVQFIRHHQSSPPRHLRGPETDWELQEILCSGSHQTVEFRLLKCTVICRWLISVPPLKTWRLLWTAIFFSLFLATCKQRTCCLSGFNTDNYDILFFNFTIYIHTLI